MDNFSQLAEIFVQSGAARQVRDKRDLEDMFLQKDEGERLRMGTAALETLEALRGATSRALEAIEDYMSRGR
jgi:3-deoxy-D-manno-octulosonic-acid transferase